MARKWASQEFVHRMEGIFMAKGPGIRQGAEVKGLRVIDIAPSLMYMMGLPIPRGLDGKLPDSVFLAEELEARPPAYFDLDDVIEGADGERKSMEDESVKQRLKGLGYIS